MANAASGMAVHDDCKLKFLELKTKRTYRYIVYKIEEKQKQVTVEKLGEPGQSYEDFTACLPADECRYAVYDFEFLTEGNVPKSRIFFIAWSPDTSKVRSKMIYASSKDKFRRELDGIQIELQATDPSEMDLDVFKSRAKWGFLIFKLLVVSVLHCEMMLLIAGFMDVLWLHIGLFLSFVL